MLFRIVNLTVFLVFGGFKIAHTEIPPAPTKPQCLIKGWPPRWNILTLLSISITSNITYKAQYCHSSLKTRFCNKHEFYKTVCTFNKTNRIKATLFQCNMTEVVWSLYPDLVDPRLPSKVKGNTLCTIIRATNNNGTSYSKKKCCSVRSNNVCTGISNLQGMPSAKRELNITWETPADINDVWNEVLIYEIRYTWNSQTKTKTFSPFTDKSRRSSRQHSVILKNLPPFTKYFIEISCYYTSPAGNFDSQVYAQTLPEAPYSPPTITYVQTVSSNDTMKSVKLQWKHPPKNKRNGIISKSVVSYRIQSNLSLPKHIPVNGSNLIIHGLTSETVIEGLDVNHDYLVTVKSCTVECSNESSEYQIKGESWGPRPSSQASTGRYLSDVIVTVLSILGVGILVIVLLGVSYAVYQRWKKKRDQAIGRVPLPEDLQDSTCNTPDISENLDSSDYARPAAILPFSVECDHERASILQNENDGDDSEMRIPSMEEIPLC